MSGEVTAMTKRISFRFEDGLDYQLQAVASVVDLFRGVSRQEESAIYRGITRAKLLAEGDPVRNPGIVTGTRLLDNLREVQLRNRLFPDQTLADNQFTIEMETGTGKTYVYLRTILELHKAYGFTKFMIVVPSVAIRKGVEKSIAMLREHFMALYDGLDLANHAFVYNSAAPKEIGSKFVETRDLSIAVLNIQAFNKESNKLRQEDEYGQILWDDIRYVSPIVIIDEPQKLEGAGRKKSASLEAIELLNPLFVLRYSATHKRLYNQVYKLDSYDAYQKQLVKRIEVKTVHGTIPKDHPYVRYVAFTKDLRAKIEIFCAEQGGPIRTRTFAVRRGADLFELSGGLAQYRGMLVLEDPHRQEPLRVGAGDAAFELEEGGSNSGFTEDDIVRIQIRLAIRTHLEKQLRILRQGHSIKVLTLFFIDAVSKFRDSSAPDGRGEYLRIFDEEYARIIEDPAWNRVFAEYPSLFRQYRDIAKVREGYFAVDKNRQAVEVDNWASVLDEEKLKAKAQEDVDRGIELILEKKDELIAFDEPLAFIFSHSALREGWDNPNVFTLCTLKRGGSDIAKKQEIGRGLRLPVDTNGNRCTDPAVNELTIIANDYYDRFAEALQNDFNAQTGFDKDEVTADILHRTLGEAGIPAHKVTAELVDTFRGELLKRGVIGAGNRLTKAADEIRALAFEDETLREHAELIREKFVAHMLAKGTKKIPVKNGDETPVENGRHGYMYEEAFVRLLEELGARMRQRTMYRVQIDSEAFVAACVEELNGLLRYRKVQASYEVETGKAGFNAQEKFVLGEASRRSEPEASGGVAGGGSGGSAGSGDGGGNGDGVGAHDNGGVGGIGHGERSRQKSGFEIVNYIMHHTLLPRLAIYRIVSALERKELLGSQDVLDLATQRIKAKLTDFKALGVIEYEAIDGFVFSDRTIFEADPIDRAMLEDAQAFVYRSDPLSRRSVHKYYKLDRAGEVAFAKALDEDPDVLLFTKLRKGGFVIDTPYGEYSPDWAVIYRGGRSGSGAGSEGEGAGDTAKLIFIIETKIGKEEKDLTPVEKRKIRCGELHFKAVADDAEFHWTNGYQDFLARIGRG